jgi:hypothetical protein
MNEISITTTLKGPISEQALVADIQKKIKSTDNTLQAFHRQWFVNIAMRRGLQYVQTELGNKVTINPPEIQDRVRITVNKIKGIHQTRLSKLVKDIPRLESVPASADEDDKDLARKGTKLLAYLWQTERMVNKITKLGSWMIDCGSGFFYVYWDPTKGPKVPVYKKWKNSDGPADPTQVQVDQEGFVLDENGQRIIEQMTIGDVAVDVISTFDIVNDQIAPTIPESGWITIRRAMRCKEIAMKWPRGKEVKPEKDMSQRAYFQRRLMSMVGGVAETFASEAQSDEEMATVFYHFEKKCLDYPKGKMIVMAGGIILDSTDLPFDDGETFPILKTDDTDVSGSFWGGGTVEDLSAVQKGYNRTFSQIIENANNHGNIKLKVPRGADLEKDAYDDSGTEILEYNPGFEPNQIQPTSMPGYVTNLLSFYDRAFEDVSGQHEVTRGQAPPGIKSGKAILALQEQDDTRFAPTKINFFRVLEQLGVMILQLYAKHQKENRTFRIIGESNFDVEEFQITPEEIASMNKDVRIQGENIIAAHKEVQKENAMEMYGQGLFGDPNSPETKKRVLKIMEFGSPAEVFDEYNQDAKNAKRENENFCSWDPKNLVQQQDPKTRVMIWTQPTYDFDDHMVHLASHNRFRKSPRYRSLTIAQRRGIDLHCELHNEGLKGPAPEADKSGQIGQGAPPAPMPTPAGPQAGSPPMGPPPG